MKRLVVSGSLVLAATAWASDPRSALVDFLGNSVPYEHFRADNPPDPINMRNLNFYLPEEDINYPCYGFDLTVTRSYNSLNYIEGPFGLGWTYNHNARISTQGNELVLVEGDGFVSYYQPDDYHDTHKQKIIGMLVQKRKEEDKTAKLSKPASGYDELKKRLETDEEFYQSQKKHYLLSQGTAQNGTYISTTRGKSWIQKTSSGYVRTMLSGRTEEYNPRGLLISLKDRNDNEMRFTYDKDKLRTIIDPCGRKLTFTYTKSNNIEKIVDSLNQTYKYTYDKVGRLTQFTAPNGEITKYFYSKRDTMVKVAFPDKSSAQLKYNDAYQVTEQSVTEEGKTSTTKYTRKIDPSNKFHLTTIAEASDGSKTTYDYYTDEYKTVETSPDGAKQITTLTPCCGKPLSITDGSNKGDFFTYGANENLEKKESSNGSVIFYTYEKKFNQIETLRYGDGKTVTFSYDDHGNLKQVQNSTKETLKITYNKRGKIKTLAKDNDISVTFEYNNYGKPIEIAQNKVGKIQMTYDPMGNTTNVEGVAAAGNKADEEEVKRKIKLTLSYLLQFLQPAGLNAY